MMEIPLLVSCEHEGVGYGSRHCGCPKCHKSSIGCATFMSAVFNE